MKIRYISDLHIDVNEDFPLELPKSDVFTVVAGDVAGNINKGIPWLKQNVSNGIIVAGNHIVYGHYDFGETIESLKDKLSDAFPENGPVKFLDVGTGVYKVVKDGVMFLGSTLYTNYEVTSRHIRNSLSFKMFKTYADKLDEEDSAALKKAIIDTEMFYSREGLNDFWKVVKTSPEDYLAYFDRTIAAFEKALAENEAEDNLPVVIVTHHAPTEEFIAAPFRSSRINSSFVNNLRPFIEAYPSIKAWIAGHVHARITKRLPNGCWLLSNPRGYYMEMRSYESQTDYGREPFRNWNSEMFLDTDDWTVSVK